MVINYLQLSNMWLTNLSHTYVLNTIYKQTLVNMWIKSFKKNIWNVGRDFQGHTSLQRIRFSSAPDTPDPHNS